MSLFTVKRSESELPRPKRPIYWSALGVVAAGVFLSHQAIAHLEPQMAVTVCSNTLLLFTAMGRRFFTGGEAPTKDKGDPT